MALKIQLRRGTAAEWTSTNPVLMQGEMGVETDTLKVKMGDGSKTWTQLQYFTQGVKGDTGATGATGATGPKGDKGDVGETGPANSLTVGTVTTGAAGSSATVTITGDAPNQTISFTLPQGIQGIQGIQGEKGDKGDGLPAGGTAGQVVVKTVSGTAWAEPTLDFISDVVITSPADKQTLQYEAASSTWKNKVASGGVSQSKPSSPIAGDAWFDTETGLLFVYYDDGNTSQWVEVKANSALDATLTPRIGTVESRATYLENYRYSPNYFINGSLEVNQRAFTSSTTSDTYGFDRWRWYYSGGTVTHTSQTFTPGDIAEPTAINYARIVTSGQSAASDRAQIFQRMEDVRTLAGKTVTFSFWAKAGSGTPSVAYEVIQNFGSGGSTGVNGSVAAGTAGKKVLSGGTAWTRYSFTFTMPSVAGKTIGASSWVSVGLWVSAGSDHATRTDTLGVQNGTFDFWGFQLEEGSTATAFRRNANSLQGELAACQRYYYRASASGINNAHFAMGYAVSTTSVRFIIPHSVTMRPIQSVESANLIVGDGVTGYAISSLSLGYAGTTQTIVTVATTGVTTYRPLMLIDNNVGTGYVGLSAEL